MTWLSPAFPVGAFSYSHGLERAVHDRLIHNGEDLAGWLTTLLSIGSGGNDALLLAEAAGAHGVALEETLCAYLQAFSGNLVQAAIRMGVIGQSGGVAIIAGLEGLIVATASRVARSTIDDLGTAGITSEIVAMRHETQHSRLFRS